MRNFQDTLEIRERYFISAFSIFMTVPLMIITIIEVTITKLIAVLQATTVIKIRKMK